MAEKYLNIPDKLLVGFKNNSSKLSYVTYYKQDNTIAKEKSWNSWRNKDIPYNEFENTPVTGIIIEGGGGGGYSWSRRKAYCQIIDPRGFELQISYENLLFILEKHLYDPVNGFTGEFLYGWDGLNIVLVPTDSDDYKYSKQVDNEKSYQPKECTIGSIYVNPKSPNTKYVFLGFLPNLSYKKDKKDRYQWHEPDLFTPEIKNKYIFAKLYTNTNNIEVVSGYEAMSASIKSKLLYKGETENHIDDMIKKYFKSFSISDIISSKPVTNIIGYNMPEAEDITDIIMSQISTDNIILDENLYSSFIKNGNYYNITVYSPNEHIFYLTKDKQHIYNITAKYVLSVNEPGSYYNKRPVASCPVKYNVDYLKEHTTCKLEITYNSVYHIKDNKLYKNNSSGTRYYSNTVLPEGGTFLKLTTNRNYYYFSDNLYIDVNDNRTVRACYF